MVFTKNTAEHADMRSAKAAEHVAENGVIADIPASDIAALTGTPAKTLADVVEQVDLVTTEVAKLTALISGGKIPVNASGVTLTADLIDLDVEAITGSGAAAKTLADLVARLSELTRKVSAWTVYRDSVDKPLGTGASGADTTPIASSIVNQEAVASLMVANPTANTTKTPIPITGGSLYIRATSVSNVTLAGYVIKRDAASTGKTILETFTCTKTGGLDGTAYIQTAGPFDVSMDTEVDILFTTGDSAGFSVWTRQI